MRNFRLDDESGHQEALFSWAAYRTGLMPELQTAANVIKQQQRCLRGRA